jgi:hypothetical protein
LNISDVEADKQKRNQAEVLAVMLLNEVLRSLIEKGVNSA